MTKRLLALWLMVCAAPVQAGEADDFVLGLYRLERCGFMAASDTARVDRIEECRDILDETSGHLDGLGEALDPDIITTVEQEWDRMSETYEQVFEDPYMMRNHYTMDDIRNTRTVITDALGDQIPKPPNPLALAVHMERMGAEYLWRAESVMGAGMSGTQILDIGQMVVEADRQFETLIASRPDDFNLQSAFAKYQFIRGSLLNYNVDMVPYLVDRYTTSIVEALSLVTRL